MKSDYVRKTSKGDYSIHEGDVFNFKYMEELNKSVQLQGVFVWNEDELRYEIDVFNHENYVCLSYVGNGTMYDFELINQ